MYRCRCTYVYAGACAAVRVSDRLWPPGSVAFLALCIVTVLACCFCRRLRSKAATPGYSLKHTAAAAAAAPVEMSALLPRQRATEFPIHKVRFLQELGEGAFGE